MKAFQTYPSEVRGYQDRISGATVHQLGDADSTTTITLHVPAGTTVERVIYTME